MAWGAVLPRTGTNKFYDLVGNPITFDESNGVMKAKLELQGENYFDGTRFQPMQLTGRDLTAAKSPPNSRLKLARRSNDCAAPPDSHSPLTYSE
jgi:hypothetical protein